MDFYRGTFFTVCAVAALAACGKKEATDSSPAPPAAASAPYNQPHFKTTEKFGSVSAVVLEPQFQVPAKYSAYVHQPLTEATPEEYQKTPDAAFEAYVATWIQQAASVDKPDWTLLAGLLHPEVAEETNVFKQQETADKAKTEIAADKNSLNMVLGWQGEILSIGGPDVASGEYYLTLRPGNRYSTVGYTNAKNYGYNLYYHPVFDAVGMQGDNGGYMQLTIKVSIDKAKEIEALREGDHAKHPGMLRIYGRVVGNKDGWKSVRKTGAEAALDVSVEAIELGTRQNGQFKPYFFLDTDQLKKSKS